VSGNKLGSQSALLQWRLELKHDVSCVLLRWGRLGATGMAAAAPTGQDALALTHSTRFLSRFAGKPLAPTITSAVGGQKTVTVVLSMPQTVNVAGITTQAIRPTKASRPGGGCAGKQQQGQAALICMRSRGAAA